MKLTPSFLHDMLSKYYQCDFFFPSNFHFSSGGKGRTLCMIDSVFQTEKEPDGPTPFWQVCSLHIQDEYLISSEHKFYGFDILHVWKAQSIAKCTLIVHCEFTEYNFSNTILRADRWVTPFYLTYTTTSRSNQIIDGLPKVAYSTNALFQQLGIILNIHIPPTGSLLELLSYRHFPDQQPEERTESYVVTT